MKNLAKIKALLLYGVIFFIPWQTRYFIHQEYINNSMWEYGTISIYLSDIFIIGWLIVFLGERLREMRWPSLQPPSTIKLLIITLLAYLIISVSWSGATVISLIFLCRLIAYGLIGQSLVARKLNVKIVILIIIVSLSLQSVLAISNLFSQQVYANKWLGIASQQASDQGVSVVLTSDARYLRAYGGMPHPNILGGWLVAGILLIIFRSSLFKSGAKMNIFLLGCFSLMFSGLILTFSRAAWGSLIVAVLLIRKKTLLPYLPIALCIIVYCVLLLSGAFTARTSLLLGSPANINRLEIKAVTERVSSWQDSWLIIKKHPVLGGGLGTYSLSLSQIYPREPAWRWQPAHNVGLLILAELGLIGILLIGALVFCIMRWLWRQEQYPAIIYLGALLFISLFDHYLWTLPAGLFLWLFSCLVIIRR